MKTVGVSEAKSHLSAVLDRVAQGERIVITRHGVPVAELVPLGRSAQATTREERLRTIEQLKEFRRGRTLGMPVREAIEEGRL